MRAITSPKSPGPLTVGPPKLRRDSAAVCHERAALMMPFDGTQPTLRQSPPIR